ncbi:carboxymuconolactone decarboxylase family protein [Futiania mangrovi]|uniref:Carboxymuconolactone decarboxylase family protein n=1 Tax=Futiania mangrovi TaxID=2959716 RepID=A0A9J6PCI5_9PROT|nr:carboxymuconolactone decarboxylase family protein [Futiania mangrovii]MCP1337037.1 carboxymuconolactone decarboxylase family protein [Futiania mangrovii]
MDKREAGRQVMREVLGEGYLERRDASTNSFNAPLRRFSEESCFGESWSRPGLARPVRSLLCLVMLTALGRTAEFRIHVGAALNNGCTPEEIQEAIYQAAVYCGLPAAVESFRIAEEVLRERGIEIA